MSYSSIFWTPRWKDSEIILSTWSMMIISKTSPPDPGIKLTLRCDNYRLETKVYEIHPYI